MLVMLDTILPTEFVLYLQFPAHLVNLDTMVSATLHAQSELVLKEVTVKELVLLELGHTTVDATEIAPLNTIPMMLVLTHAQLEQLFKMEFVKLDLNHALLDNTLMPLHLHARPVNILALNAH
jgi:hypothetical protein